MASRRSARVVAQAEGREATSRTVPPLAAPTSQSKKRKASLAVSGDAGEKAQAPATPRKRKKSAVLASTSTPTATPSAARLIAEPAAIGDQSASQAASTAETPKPKPRDVARLAEHNSTNGPLLSPETSRVISHVSVDTSSILEEACSHLIKVEPRMEPLIKAHMCRIFSPAGLAEKIDPFESLVSGIISQQVSGAAAKSIKGRFIDLFDAAMAAEATTTTTTKKFPTPSQVSATTTEKLKSAGLSQRKAEYIQGLAAKFAAGDLTAQWLADAPYDDVLERLMAVRGLGRWSIEMFACFGLKRLDVFSTGDLGVQRGMAAFAGRDVAKLKAKGSGNKWKYMSEQDMLDMAAPFSPYRSLFMWYMWRVEETDISTLE